MHKVSKLIIIKVIYRWEWIFLEWIISANHNKYYHVRAFKELPYIDWKKNANYSV